MCSLEDFIAFLREHHDLGITGDDGVELIQAIQKRFEISSLAPMARSEKPLASLKTSICLGVRASRSGVRR